MKLVWLAALLLCLICNNVFAQSLKITSIGSPDRVSAMILQKQLVGKRVELTLFKDSALVFIAPLHQTEKLKQISMNQYMRTDTVDKDISSSLLTVNKIQDHLLSINLKLTKSNQAGDKKETWIIAKP